MLKGAGAAAGSLTHIADRSLSIVSQKPLPDVDELCLNYFKNQKTLDETVKVIQNRIQLYLDESG